MRELLSTRMPVASSGFAVISSQPSVVLQLLEGFGVGSELEVGAGAKVFGVVGPARIAGAEVDLDVWTIWTVVLDCIRKLAFCFSWPPMSLQVSRDGLRLAADPF